MDTPPIIAGRFRVECEIGRGGMGTVYRASHLGLERPVAVKILKPEFAADPQVAERFMREARTMARLRHAGAAMIFDAGRLDDGRPFIVMEHVEGVTLAETLAREGAFTSERAVRIAAEICDVLAEAHSLGIVHRDLKPSNIMLSERGVRVLDFGIAKVLANSADAARTHATTQSGIIIGTPRYMSPEQCMGRRVGPASDLYSLGVLVYEMLAGHPPFVDQLPSAVLVKQATSAPPPLVALRADAPRSLVLAVHTLLAKNPANRPVKAADARALLEGSIARAKIPAELLPSPFTATIAALDAGSSAAFRSATIFVLMLMLGGLLFAWSHGSRSAARVADASHDDVPSMRVHESIAQPASISTLPALSTGAAQRIASSAVSRGSVSDVRIVRTRGGQAIAAIYDRQPDGATHFCLMERRGKSFRVTGRAPLSVDGFRGARWTAEVVDIDGDGYDEIICTGTQSARRRDGQQGRRHYVLYVPRSRQTYSLRVASDVFLSNTLRAVWSPNSATDKAHAYRSALRRRAFAAPSRSL